MNIFHVTSPTEALRPELGDRRFTTIDMAPPKKCCMGAAVAAIQFALDDEDGFDFLSYWNQGDFDVIRRNWPDAPESVHIGADPLHPATAAELERELDGERLAKLLEFCTEAKPHFGPRGELRTMTMKFKNSVETSVGYQKELRKLIDEIQPASQVPL